MPYTADSPGISVRSARKGEWTAPLQRHLRQFVSTSSLLSLARVAGAAAGFVTQILLARTLQASALGLFYSVTSLAAVMGVVAALGYPKIAPRFVSRYREKGNKGLLPAFVGPGPEDDRGLCCGRSGFRL